MEFTQEELDDLGLLLCSLKKISDFLKDVKCLDPDGFYISENICNPNPPLNFTQTTSVMFGDNLRDIEQVIIRFLDGVLNVAGLADSFSNLADNIECVCNGDINFAPLNDLKNLDLPVTALNDNLEQVAVNTNPISNLLPLIENIRDKFIEPKIVAEFPISNYTYDDNNKEGGILPGGDIQWVGDEELLSVRGSVVFDQQGNVFGRDNPATFLTVKPVVTLAEIREVRTDFNNIDHNNGLNRSAAGIVNYTQPLEPYILNADVYNADPNHTDINGAGLLIHKNGLPTGTDNVIEDFYQPDLTEDYIDNNAFRTRIFHYVEKYKADNSFIYYSLFFGLNGCDQTNTRLMSDGTFKDVNNTTINNTIVSKKIGYCRMGIIFSIPTHFYQRTVYLETLHTNL